MQICRKLLLIVRVTRRKIVASLNCNYELLISKINGFITICVRVNEINLIRVSCDI
jgi:hypothetical protein